MKSWPIETFRISYNFKKFLPTQLLPPTCLFVFKNFALLHVYSLLHDYLIPYSTVGFSLECLPIPLTPHTTGFGFEALGENSAAQIWNTSNYPVHGESFKTYLKSF